MDHLNQLIISSVLNNIESFVTRPTIGFLLLLLFFLGVVIQLFSTKINLFGVIAFISLTVFYAGHLLSGENSVIGLILFIIAAVLIIIEFFVIGTFLGVIGLILLLASIVIVSPNIVLYSIFLMIILSIAAISMVILMKFSKKRIPILSRLILTDSTNAESGYSSFDDRSYLMGQIAKSVTPLRPSGTIRLGEDRIDAVAESTYIEQNKDVKIVHVEGTRIVVRPVD